jgi:hypothetical protein
VPGSSLKTLYYLTIDALAGLGLLSLCSTVVLALILCVDWRGKVKRRRRMHMASRCQYCNYTDRRDKVTLHEAKDHVERGR